MKQINLEGGDRPQVIFLDAVGTLFGVKGSVGEVYRQLARQFGVEVEAAALDKAFYHSFKTAEAMAFPSATSAKIPKKEYEWWEKLAHRTFERAGVGDRFSNFPEFFAALYAHFATAQPWEIYPDVFPALKYWQSQGISLGVLSNFDTRLYSVLSDLELAAFFTSVTISTEVGAAKPHPKIFHKALAKQGCPPEKAWHIGDSFKEDYEGAKALGIRAIWIKRS